jgi:hypothetical protein
MVAAGYTTPTIGIVESENTSFETASSADVSQFKTNLDTPVRARGDLIELLRSARMDIQLTKNEFEALGIAVHLGNVR